MSSWKDKITPIGNYNFIMLPNFVFFKTIFLCFSELSLVFAMLSFTPKATVIFFPSPGSESGNVIEVSWQALVKSASLEGERNACFTQPGNNSYHRVWLELLTLLVVKRATDVFHWGLWYVPTVNQKWCFLVVNPFQMFEMTTKWWLVGHQFKITYLHWYVKSAQTDFWWKESVL